MSYRCCNVLTNHRFDKLFLVYPWSFRHPFCYSANIIFDVVIDYVGHIHYRESAYIGLGHWFNQYLALYVQGPDNSRCMCKSLAMDLCIQLHFLYQKCCILSTHGAFQLRIHVISVTSLLIITEDCICVIAMCFTVS